MAAEQIGSAFYVPAPKPARKVLPFVVLWFLFSFLGIILNKHLVSAGHGVPVSPLTMALVQTASTVLWGGLSQLWIGRPSRSQQTGRDVQLKLLGLGVLRFGTVVLGLISLREVAASFTETVKASSPFFTALAALLLVGEQTSQSLLVALTLVAGGLAIASAGERSFTQLGFLAAVATNVVESVQNVLCKRYMQKDSDGPAFTSTQLQYYSAVASLIVQLPFFVGAFACGVIAVPREGTMVLLLAMNGFIYYAQSALVFRIMSHYSPVTVSVLNTAKRAMIICASSLYFGNEVTPIAQFGTAITLLGGALYSHLKCREAMATASPLLAVESKEWQSQEKMRHSSLLSGFKVHQVCTIAGRCIKIGNIPRRRSSLFHAGFRWSLVTAAALLSLSQWQSTSTGVLFTGPPAAAPETWWA